ncbi:MAG: LacI family transcriptional regulator [Opitutaceae bacterium]|jgi:LacI family transcriptional regulator|nr:LacI family transcriptional regulator [Opitutaceae bacterium]
MSTTATPKISQQRIARDLGLSQALVSMVLNGRTEGISEESYRRIWDHALGLGYQPKGMRAPSSGDATKQIHVGFILRAGLALHTQSNYFSHIQHGLHEALQERGISTLFLGTEDKLSETAFRSTIETRRSLFGVVVMGEVKPAFLKQIKQLCPRVVAVSISYPGQCHSVQSNENQSLDLLVEHLAELGHRRFAWLGGNRALMRHEDRYRAFRAALRSRDIAFDERWALLHDSADRIEGRQLAEQFLARKAARPTALVCYNGLMARGAINLLLARGVRIPEDLSVVAIDATRICTEEHPLLTAASADPEIMGRKTAELLLSASGAPDEIYLDAALPSRLTLRETTAAPAG